MPQCKLSKVGIAASATLLSLSLTTTNAIAQPTITPVPAPTSAPLTTPLNSNTVQESLVGEWQLKDILPLGIKAIFTADGKLYVFIPSSFPFFDGFTQTPIALDFRYRVNYTKTPYQLDVSAPSGGEPLLTIFELPSSGQMRVEFVGLKTGDPRPSEFTVGTVILEKLSNTTALPRNTQLIDVQAEQNKQSQSNARYRMSSINSSQSFFYSKNKKFASSVSELNAYLPPDNNYTYDIKPHPNQKPGAIATAIPKSASLKSYTAVIVAIKIKGKSTVFNGICESTSPSKTAPAAPKIDNKGQLICPSGSVSVK